MTWQEREAIKFIDGTYKRVPWYTESFYLNSEHCGIHFAHVSTQDSSMVAYTHNPDKGVADLQTMIKPGRYLTRFFKDKLSPNQIRDWAAAFASANESHDIHFESTQDGIERVYVDGPSSCMSYTLDSREFQSHMHPVRVYAAGDIRIAYLKRGNGRITARALVYKNYHCRVYGDNSRLTRLLESKGFERGSFQGARILKIENDIGENSGEYILPYIDSGEAEDGDISAASVADHGDHFKIVEHGGDYIAENINGLACGGKYCQSCESRSNSSFVEIYNSDSICYDCFCQEFFQCENCHYNYHTESLAGETIGGITICESCASEYHSLCPTCETLFHTNNESGGTTSDDETICENCADESYRESFCGIMLRNEIPRPTRRATWISVSHYQREADCVCDDCEGDRAFRIRLARQRRKAQTRLIRRTIESRLYAFEPARRSYTNSHVRDLSRSNPNRDYVNPFQIAATNSANAFLLSCRYSESQAHSRFNYLVNVGSR